jgi:aspartyl-tRNA(Asn)/glutamyl-tRNA(Gln) amidotransferase subunit A
MTTTPDNPFARMTLVDYGARLRRREISAEAVTSALLERIERLNPRLNAFHYVARDDATAAARAVDRALAAGTDWGPLMGVPVAVKDLYRVAGMPTNAGSNLDISDLVPPEGSFVRALRRCGCVILGKTRTSEFALGGINFIHPVPWNPCDALTHRMPGGSSHGSAVALAAGLCAFSAGTDTGGSVRLPAALCGVAGHKFSSRAFALDGIFPLSPTLDSVGSFTTSTADSALVYHALTGTAAAPAMSLEHLRFGKPDPVFFDDLDAAVGKRVEAALRALEGAGAQIIPVKVPEIAEFEPVFGGIVPGELVEILGRARIEQNRGVFDSIAGSRLIAALEYPPARLAEARARQAALRDAVRAAMRGLDGWITPTTPLVPGPLAECATLDAALAWNRRALRNTRIGNVFEQCAISLPLAARGGGLPVGLQIVCPALEDAKLVALAAAVESAVGRAQLPDVAAFAGGAAREQ